MGIKGLTKLIADNAPDAGKEHAKLDAYFEGRKIAFDASMALYQVRWQWPGGSGVAVDGIIETARLRRFEWY
jgi:hypothetical protein